MFKYDFPLILLLQFQKWFHINCGRDNSLRYGYAKSVFKLDFIIFFERGGSATESYYSAKFGGHRYYRKGIYNAFHLLFF